MANKQYVFSGTGNPDDNSIAPEVATAHYVDTASNDVWMWNGADWNRVYAGDSFGNVALYSNYNPPTSPPLGPEMYVSYGGGIYKVHVSSRNSDGEWLWVEMDATATT